MNQTAKAPRLRKNHVWQINTTQLRLARGATVVSLTMRRGPLSERVAGQLALDSPAHRLFFFTQHEALILDLSSSAAGVAADAILEIR